MLLSLAQWIQSLGFFVYLRESHYAYPAVLSLHMVTLAFFGGMILLTDLRLLGWAMSARPVSDIVDQLRTPKRVGFLFMATLGIMLFGCKAEEYYFNPFFRVKVTLLALIAVHAIVFRRSVYSCAGSFDSTWVVPKHAKLAAGLSMLLWAAIACMGRGIGYLDPPFGLHAQLWR
jgi:hypothetical protein